MKVLGIVCSPRKKGNTEVLVSEALASAKSLGADVEIINIATMNIAPCNGCLSCLKTGKCKIKDDMQVIYTKLTEADGLIFGSPVYFWSVTAQAKALIDRTYVLLKVGRQLRNKIAGAIVVTHRAGGSEAFSVFSNFFSMHRMVSVAGALAYRNDEEIAMDTRGGGVVAYGDKKGEVVQDKRGMAEARSLGAVMAKTIQKYKECGLL